MNFVQRFYKKHFKDIRVLHNVVNVTKNGDVQKFIVIDRMPKFVYEREGNYLLAEDSGFYSCFGYQRSQWDKAFGGRKFDILLKNGEVEKADGQWWHSHYPKWDALKLSSPGIGTVEDLKKCYVFCSGLVLTEKLNECKSEPISYREYEKQLRQSTPNKSKMRCT